MTKAAVGILAHVDAGKTTLAEALLHHAGAIRATGRVDSGTSHLDTDPQERERGITIFSSTAPIVHRGAHLTLVDTPGHTDFAAETERTLGALDCAVLVVAANDGVQGHTSTLHRLLDRYEVPTFVFVNKMDLADKNQAEVLEELRRRLDERLVDFSDPASPQLLEACATSDEDALEEFLDTGSLAPATLRRLVAERKVTPCFFGSALRDEGVGALLDGLAALAPSPSWPDEFAARAYNVSHDNRGERLVWLKMTGGTLSVKDAVGDEKVNQIRIYSGDRFDMVPEVDAGDVCAVTGLSSVMAGDVLGAEPAGRRPSLEPTLSYAVLPGSEDPRQVHEALLMLADEDPQLHVSWDAETREVRLSLMGPIQQDVVRRQLQDRFGLDVSFGPGSILYRETITAPVRGIGHFEPLRHYAEAHVLLEPLPRGRGLEFGTVCSTDDLDLNWQRLILTHAMEREHRGVLIGAPVTDLRITLLGGRAHAKHTEGGDFRQATYRAIRQGLMMAREAGACQVLEPWQRFELEVPEASLGRALADLPAMSARFSPPEVSRGFARIEGCVPASELGDYAVQVAAYTHGHGHLSCEFSGYEPCHDAERVIGEAAYEPEADLPSTPDSVFCSHGAGYPVKWHDVPAMAHVDVDAQRKTPWRPADDAFFGR